MSLSRLQNLLNAPRGTKFYVDVNALDATDSIENRGTSPTRPFRSIARALAEVARYSYQSGFNNDRFGKSTVIIAPGTYYIDNRPGAVVKNDGSLVLRNGATTTISQWDLTSNFDLSVADNDLYKLNSVHGGLIVPRGCVLSGENLRGVKIVPLYVPDPENGDIERSAIFRVTGASLYTEFSIFDSDPNGNCYKDYTRNLFTPNFSHHKLTAFEYADGVNPVVIDDEFQTVSTNFTDLEMYYDKIARVYGESSGRSIPDATYSGETTIDIQPVVDEYRIVGSRGKEVGITSIRAGDGGANPTNIITVTIDESIDDLSVDSPIQVSGISAPGYTGQFVVSGVISDTELQYKTQTTPVDPLPIVLGATLNLTVDTVTSASPYIFNVSLRSVYGMCGLHADGSKADGFKSMVVAQFTGIGLQKDDDAFVLYDNVIGAYRDSTTIVNLHTNSRARFKPEYENYHIKASNNAFLQLVSVFAIGYAKQLVAESGGDFSVTNSNSSFGAKALFSSGFRNEAFTKDDVGYITHVIPPQEIETEERSVEFLPVDVGLTTSRSAGAATTTRLYLYNETNIDEPPVNVIDGYRIGAKRNDILKVQINQAGITSEFSAKIIIPNTTESYEKAFDVAKTSLGENNVVSSIITLTSTHNFQNGESVRVVSDNGHLPDGLSVNQVYYIITNESKVSLGSTRVQLSQTLNGAILGEELSINGKGGNLKIVSRVTDKSAGDIGHPIQWDTVGNWYINVSASNNTLYDTIRNLGVAGLGQATSKTYITRNPDTRSLVDTLYRFRYVIPKDSPIGARPPLEGYIIQESSTNSFSDADVQNYFSDSSVTLTSSTDLRNPRFIADVKWSSGSVTVTTELPHDLRVGAEVELENVVPLGYNGTYTVTEILNSRQFKYSLATNPGTFSNNTTSRDSSLPVLKKRTLSKTYQIYSIEEVTPYVQNEQDGVYNLVVTNNSNSPTVSPFRDLKFSQPIQNLYPQTNRDNPNSDPSATRSFALPEPIGQVVIDNPESSITKETLEYITQDFNIGFGVTALVSNVTGTAHTIFTSTEHGLAGITGVSIVSGGSNYEPGTYYAADAIGFGSSTVGSNASLKVVVGGAGTITSVEIMSGGSAYGIGNTLSVVPAAGIGTTTGFTAGVIQVTSISNDIGDVIRLSGIGGTFGNYNTLYRVTGISDPKAIQVSSASTVSGSSTVTVNSTITQRATATRTGKSLVINSFDYSASSGIATVGFSTSHGLSVNNKIRLSGFDNDYFNRDVIVKRQNSLTSVVVSVGKNGSGLPTTGTRYAYPSGYSSGGGTTNRQIEEYGGVTTKLNTQLLVSSTTDELDIDNALSLGLKLGDYLKVGGEIFRIKTTVTSDTVEVFRSLFGTQRETHAVGSVVKKILVNPVELRRNSIIRASGHTFEYVGFGAGNYSTALPERQDRLLSSQEELIAQSTKENGGVVIFSAMNSDGDFYNGNKKTNSITGQEEVFDVPVSTVTGEELPEGPIDIVRTQEVNVSRSIRIEGGENNNLISEFDGPVVFNKKLTSNDSIETNSLLIQGDEVVSREISISNQKPTIVGSLGDVKFNSAPRTGGNAGWIYTKENDWKPFGWINDSLYGVGISTNSGPVGFSTLLNIVGVGLTIRRDYDNATGITTVYFEGDPINTLGISSGGTPIGDASALNFVGSNQGFGVNIAIDYDSLVGLATVTISNPIGIINFGDGVLGYAPPSFATTSIGTRVVYDERLNASNTNYAVGIGADDSLWWSVPQNNSYAFKWYGGETEIASLLSNGALTILGSSTVTAGRFISTVSSGTSPISVASSTIVSNLNAEYLGGFVSAATTSPNTIVRRDASNNINGNVSHLRHSTAGAQRGEWYADIPARLGYTPFNRAGDTCTGAANFDGLTTIKKVSDIYTNVSSSGLTLTCNFDDGPITRTTSTDITTINIENVPTTNNRALNYTVVMNAATSVANLGNIQFQINGASLSSGGNSIRWLNNIPPTGTSAGYYFFGFTIFRVGSAWEVIAVFATYA